MQRRESALPNARRGDATRLLTLAPLLVAALLTVDCANPTPPQATAPPRHVLLITIDTLRADRLGCYGSHDVETPHIDRIAREGAIAPEAMAPAPITRPSHVSIFTGLYPAQHGIRDNISRALPPDVPTLAEAFKAAGFATAGFVSSIVLSRQSGLARGFDAFSDKFDVGADAADEARFLDILETRGDVAVGHAVAWLDAHAQQRTFMWVHLYDPHAPYDPPEPFASKYADHPYDGEVAWSDELVGRLEAALERHHLGGETLVAVTSDHGEALGEHGEAVHGYFLYQATLRVPLVMRGPGIAPGTRIPSVVRSIDLFPTVLDLAMVPAPASSRRPQGRSFASTLRGAGAPADEPAFAESLTPRIHYGWSDLRTIRDGRWKFILAPKPELYDLVNDNGELRNLVAEQPARARALRSALEQHLADESRTATPVQTGGDIPADLVERLGALGYASGSAAPSTSSGADPKDKIDAYKSLNATLHDGLLQLRDRKYEAAVGRFRELAAQGLDSFESHYYFGQALLGLRRWPEAADQFDRAIPRLPGFAASYLMLAECRVAMRDRAGAISALQRGVQPAAGDARLYRRLGELHRDEGHFDQAVADFREAIARDDGEASQWNSMGMLVGAEGRLGDAEQAFRAAVKRDPRESRYTYNLALTLEREERIAEAIEFYRKTVELNPRFVPAQEKLKMLSTKN